MNFRRKGFLHHFLLIMFAVGLFAGASYAQFTVTLSGPSPSATPNPSPTATPAPSGSFTVSAAVTGNANSITKVVFYRNDVPYETDTTSTYSISQNQLGQDTYTYRARAYDSTGVWVDSSDFKLTVYTPLVFKMGDPVPRPSPSPPLSTTGPDRYHDHTIEVQAAVDYLSGQGGGTLFFPCKLPYLPPPNQTTRDTSGMYNIRNTINIPSNVTLQGESAEEGGRCRINWQDVSWDPGIGCFDNASTYPLVNKPMFKIAGGVSRVRFRDIWLYSRSSGKDCYPRHDWDRIDDEGTRGIEMSIKGDTGHITDVVFENVSITNFTYGIKAVADPEFDWGISDIKIRGYRPLENHRQLFIDDKYAHNWDVQNFNITNMEQTQGGIEIVNAGKPSGYTGMLGKLKFLQVNCAANRAYPPAFCVQVEKHGGLYFRQLHHEGVARGIVVQDISARSAPNTNEDPIVFEAGIASGKFYDASMKLYLIGNNAQAPDAVGNFMDDARLRFIHSGVNSTLVDCGDVHTDWTDVQDDGNPSDPTAWEDLKMLFTHAERNRASFYAETGGVSYIKQHTYCPSGVSGVTNINEVGGEYFNSGVLPTAAGLYSNVLSTANVSTVCPSGDIAACLEDLMDYNEVPANNGGAVYIDGMFTVSKTVNIPRGMEITGAPGAELKFDNGLTGTDTVLFRIKVPISLTDPFGTSGIAIRNLKLKNIDGGMRGIEMVGENSATVGVGRDINFSGLAIEGFETGLYAGAYSSTTGQPMIDGFSMKNMSFAGNETAVRLHSGNVALWNVMNLSVSTTTDNDVGWSQTFGGHQNLQGVTCQGTSTHKMKDCVNVAMGGLFYLTGLKQTTNVTNSLTVDESGPVGEGIYASNLHTNLVVRDNDFTSSVADTGRVNVLGKAFITSLNNKYQYFNVGTTTAANVSRLTYCGDSYPGTPYGSGLDDLHPNLWTWVPTATRVQCGTRPIPWDDALWLGGESGDLPLVGNFYDDVREDFVIYRPGSQSQFLIKKAPNGTASQAINWGSSTYGDIPLIGRFYNGTRAQIAVFRPTTGAWWVKDPNTSNTYTWSWGANGDVPFVGNFFDESGPVKDNMDEIAIYRPSTKTFWITNPRTTGVGTVITTTPDNDSIIQVGDFRGSGYDQIAQYKNGTWNILDPRTGTTYSTTFGTTGDVPVAGKYLSGSCAQLGVWRPGSQEFRVADVPNGIASCGARGPLTMIWGSNNDFLGTSYDDDIPLTINTADGSLRRPTAYRKTKGAFPASIANGQWWVHDPF